MTRYLIENIDVNETNSEEEMQDLCSKNFRGYVYDGITTYELCHILKEYFGVVAVYCCDLIQRIKLEMDMYCPDHQHLYFVEPSYLDRFSSQQIGLQNLNLVIIKKEKKQILMLNQNQST